jgi:NTE family protein
MKAIVLSGGGAKGGWSAGCLFHLLHDLKMHYQILCGVSVGAINAAFLAQFHKGQEVEAAIQLWDLWSKLENKSVYKRWFPFGRYHCLWKNSFYDSSPLHKLMRSNISLERIRATGKHVSVGLVSLTSGKYKIFDQTSDDFVSAVIASASFPCLFQPVKIGDELFTDGGVKTITPINTAIDFGATEIHAVVTSPEIRDKKFFKQPSIIDVMTRSFDLYTEKIMSNDIDKAIAYNRLAEAKIIDNQSVKLHIIRPKRNLVEDFLDFDPEKIKKMMDIGYNDAVEQLIM